ncbi:MAG TPA: transglutaminase domain-containing protein [Tepidisphaeraceae bacterium]|jgi:transglutaminase-like putative cysteine protease
MKSTLVVLAVVAAALWLVQSARAEAKHAKARDFLFTFQVSISSVPVDQAARIWLPVPPSNREQSVVEAERQVPGDVQVNEEPKHGNRILFTMAKPEEGGSIDISVTYRISRHEVNGEQPVEPTASQAESTYLLADARVPVGGKALRLLDGKKLPLDLNQRARMLYDVVADHLEYRKDKPGWGNGDSDWACDSGFGNCTDFHSLFISLARAQQIPAKFEMGFPLPPERGEGAIPGYHCWAKFKTPGHGWTAVDISEARKHPELRDYYFGNLTEDRVMFSTGRDLTLVPKQDGQPLNFFVYPYVEVDGKVWPADKIKRTFRYRDVQPDPTKQQSRADVK